MALLEAGGVLDPAAQAECWAGAVAVATLVPRPWLAARLAAAKATAYSAGKTGSGGSMSGGGPTAAVHLRYGDVAAYLEPDAAPKAIPEAGSAAVAGGWAKGRRKSAAASAAVPERVYTCKQVPQPDSLGKRLLDVLAAVPPGPLGRGPGGSSGEGGARGGDSDSSSSSSDGGGDGDGGLVGPRRPVGAFVATDAPPSMVEALRSAVAAALGLPAAAVYLDRSRLRTDYGTHTVKLITLKRYNRQRAQGGKGEKGGTEKFAAISVPPIVRTLSPPMCDFFLNARAQYSMVCFPPLAGGLHADGGPRWLPTTYALGAGQRREAGVCRRRKLQSPCTQRSRRCRW